MCLYQYYSLPTSTCSTAASTYVKSTDIAVSKHMLGSVVMKSRRAIIISVLYAAQLLHLSYVNYSN